MGIFVAVSVKQSRLFELGYIGCVETYGCVISGVNIARDETSLCKYLFQSILFSSWKHFCASIISPETREIMDKVLFEYRSIENTSFISRSRKKERNSTALVENYTFLTRDINFQ